MYRLFGIALFVCLLTAASPPMHSGIEAAIAAGRLEQARTMIARASPDALEPKTRLRLLADVALAERNDALALAGYEAVLKADSEMAEAAAGAGTSLLRLGRTSEALAFLKQATSKAPRRWENWNALGVAMDRSGDWSGADKAYRRAINLAPRRAEPLNNLGYSLLLQGKTMAAQTALEAALKLDPKNDRARTNHELARAMMGHLSVEQRSGETEDDLAVRLNNAGYVAWLIGDLKSAKALLSRALHLSSRWSSRAANNLSRVEGQ